MESEAALALVLTAAFPDMHACPVCFDREARIAFLATPAC